MKPALRDRLGYLLSDALAASEEGARSIGEAPEAGQATTMAADDRA